MSASLAISSTDNENSASSGGDSKKRNKLGYHRSAVACGHCRRRKIRCVPALDSQETKCQNCIRLRKECQFFPVDHPNSPTKANRSESRKNSAIVESETSRTSPASALPGSTVSEHDDSEISTQESIANAWISVHEPVSSPGHFERDPHSNPQLWNSIPTPVQYRGPFQHDLHGDMNSNIHWVQGTEASTSQFRQHSFPGVPHSGAGQYDSDPRLAYQNNLYGTEGHNFVGQNINSVPMTGSIQQQTSRAFHEMTDLPIATIDSSGHTGYSNIGTQMNAQLSQEQLYYGYPHGFPQQMPQHSPGGESWMVGQVPQQRIQQPYQPSQRRSAS